VADEGRGLHHVLRARVSREHSQKVTVEMSLNPAVPLIASEAKDGLSTEEIIN
jgi:hypothetical protein